MMLFRYYRGKDVTLGVLWDGSGLHRTLERPWKDNQQNQSCIPDGEYPYNYMPHSSSGRYKGCYHVRDVPGRFGILIHAGNVVDETKGCILIGDRIGVLGGKKAVLNSRSALRRMNSRAAKSGILRVF